MKPFNDGTHRPEGTMSLKRFVENEYLPFIQRQKRPSTYCGYRKMWSWYLASRSEMALRDFRTFDCERLLGEIAEVYAVSTTTLRHVKNMLSGIFRYATRTGILHVPNPVRDACAPKGNASNETYAYSLEEITRMLAVLPGHVVPVVAAAAFTGVRKGELRGFLWENYSGQQIRITQSVWNRHITDPKTIRSTAPVPIIGALARMYSGSASSVDGQSGNGFHVLWSSGSTLGSGHDRPEDHQAHLGGSWSEVDGLAWIPAGPGDQALSAPCLRQDDSGDIASSQRFYDHEPVRQGRLDRMQWPRCRS